mmetsp:Transcript_42833/g.104699  ORF Transcript_42833/g.104699 Transcript_42833/m.104699 type:complete len:155 (-) Transcript_42833:60-524(-)
MAGVGTIQNQNLASSSGYWPHNNANYTSQNNYASMPPQQPMQGSPQPQTQVNDHVAGIGIHFTPNHEGMHIVTGMRPGGPAESCGRILVGDILWKVDDVPVKNQPIQNVIRMLTGPTDSTVTLSVLDGKFPYLPAKLCQCQRAMIDNVGVQAPK